MKSIKKILALTVAAALSVSCFAGCGKKANGDTIVIGSSGPLTGDNAQYGVAVKNAAELAVKKVNDDGGINGIKLSLVFEDDEADPGDKAVNAYNALKDNGMQVMMGTVTTGSCLAVIESKSIVFGAEDVVEIKMGRLFTSATFARRENTLRLSMNFLASSSVPLISNVKIEPPPFGKYLL